MNLPKREHNLIAATQELAERADRMASLRRRYFEQLRAGDWGAARDAWDELQRENERALFFVSSRADDLLDDARAVVQRVMA